MYIYTKWYDVTHLQTIFIKNVTVTNSIWAIRKQPESVSSYFYTSYTYNYLHCLYTCSIIPDLWEAETLQRKEWVGGLVLGKSNILLLYYYCYLSRWYLWLLQTCSNTRKLYNIMIMPYTFSCNKECREVAKCVVTA